MNERNVSMVPIWKLAVWTFCWPGLMFGHGRLTAADVETRRRVRSSQAGRRRRTAILAGEHDLAPSLLARRDRAGHRSFAAGNRGGHRAIRDHAGSQAAPPRRRSAAGAALSRRAASADRFSRRRGPAATRNQDQRVHALGRDELRRGRHSRGDLVEPGSDLSGAHARADDLDQATTSSWRRWNGIAAPTARSISSARLPNGIRFGTKVIPSPEAVRMEMWLTNGTPADALRLARAELRDAQGRRRLRGADRRQQGVCRRPMSPAARATAGAGSSRPGSLAIARGPIPLARACTPIRSFPIVRPAKRSACAAGFRFTREPTSQAELRRIDATRLARRELK